MTKSDLMRKMHRAGLRLDDAALAAQVAVNAMTAERQRVISRVRAVLTVRQVAELLGLGKTSVARVPCENVPQSIKNAIRANRLMVIRQEYEKGFGYSLRAACRLGMTEMEVRVMASRNGIAQKRSTRRLSHESNGDGTASAPNLHATADG